MNPDDLDTVVMNWSHTAKHALRAMVELQDKFDELQAVSDADPEADRAELMRVGFKMLRHASTAVVFFVLAMEAYINFYAVMRLGKTYTERYVDRLDLVSKWVVVPHLALGQRVLPEGETLANLRKVVGLRNQIAHPKAGPYSSRAFESGVTGNPVMAAAGLREGALLAASCVYDLCELMNAADDQCLVDLMAMDYIEE